VRKARPRPERATDLPGDTSPFALGLMMRRAHDRAASELTAAVRPLGLGLRHFAVLIELSKQSPQSQRELGDKIGRDTAGMVRIIDDLEAAGYAVRRPHPSDRRIRAVELTPAGLQAFDAIHDAAQPIADQLVSHLRPGEAERLMDLLTRFTYPPADE
jgi:MarR family transcriptional regulator, lower aerobic nicotinate degradation pathway regulator